MKNKNTNTIQNQKILDKIIKNNSSFSVYKSHLTNDRVSLNTTTRHQSIDITGEILDKKRDAYIYTVFQLDEKKIFFRITQNSIQVIEEPKRNTLKYILVCADGNIRGVLNEESIELLSEAGIPTEALRSGSHVIDNNIAYASLFIEYIYNHHPKKT
jgi:hypothetical protein